jgi:putative ABC transport system permease protein
MNDIRLAFRLCRRHPVLSLAAIVSLALGIGANTAIFTVLNGSVLRPLPYAEPDRLVVVWETTSDNPRRSVAPANFVDWRRETSAFAGLAAFDDFSAAVTGHGEAQRVRAVSASADLFAILGVQAQTGRVLSAPDDAPGAAPVAVLTDGLWQRLFGGAANAVGRPLVMNGVPHVVIGVLPAAFGFQMSDAEVWVNGDRGVPLSIAFPGDVDITAVRDSHMISVIGRLAAGVSREQAQAQLTSVMQALSLRYPATNAGLGANAVPLHEEIVGNVRPVVLLLQIAVAALLLIACANVAHLLLGQAAGREAELALRVALGADRRRLVRQLLVETLLIAIPGGVAGLALAVLGVRVLVAAAPPNMPRLSEVGIDGTVMAFTVAVTLLTALVFGLWPALQAARRSAGELGQAGRRLAGHRRVRRGHQAIVVGELAVAQVLLVGAGLLLASFMQATRIDLGFATTDRVAAEISLTPEYVATNEAGRIDPSRKIRFIQAVIDRMREAPGVGAAAASFTAPLTGAPNRGIRIEGDPPAAPGQEPNADFQIVTPDFFRAMGITLAAGRTFDATDRAEGPRVAIINRALADKYFAGRDPIGRVLVFGGTRRHQITGVVADARYRSVERPADPTFYLPLEQNDERWPFVTFTVLAGPPPAGTPAADTSAAGMATLLRTAVRSADPLQPISRLRSLDEIVDQSTAARRFNTWIVTLFAATALVLAAVGVYGVMAFAVTARTRELGVRAALGARPGELIRMILGQGLLLTLLATAIGAGLSLLLTRFMASMLFAVTPRDPLTFVVVMLVLVMVALAATWVPARRAMKVNPVVALREG